MAVKILFAPDSGRLLGAQIMGKDGVDKRIDVFATAIRHRLTVHDLTELELAYAPPYGSAKDPVNMAGFVGQNILDKRMSIFHAEDLEKFDAQKQVLLDVRTVKEVKKGTIEKACHIPVDELRKRLGELDREKEILIFCQIGFRGYLAERILVHNGFRAKSLSGGYKTYFMFQ
jgi:rhodanese-related sulfurtransferase